MNRIAVYETIQMQDVSSLIIHLILGHKVYVIEPIHGYHQNSQFRFYPKALPHFIKKLVQQGTIECITSKQLNARDIYFKAGDLAVENIEDVFKGYKKQQDSFINLAVEVLGSDIVVDAYKKELCDHLAEYYSVAVYVERLKSILDGENFDYYPAINTVHYRQVEELLLEKQFQLSFSVIKVLIDFLGAFIKTAIGFLKILFLWLGASLAPTQLRQTSHKVYKFGVAILSPNRQLKKGRFNPDFLIDGEHISSKDTAYFCFNKMEDKHKQFLEQQAIDYYLVPRLGRIFSNPKAWGKLLMISCRSLFNLRMHELRTTTLLFSKYFAWNYTLDQVKVKKFITHSDFDLTQIARNIALKQRGVETWYYTDSVNFSTVYRTSSANSQYRHPFWSYLFYDHFVTSAQAFVDYFQSHPTKINHFHVIGNLWADHFSSDRELPESELMITVFDTTYTRNSLTSYEEGIAFAQDILQLANDFENIHILFKEKKNRGIHIQLDEELGPKLIDFYEQMEQHDRITFVKNTQELESAFKKSRLFISFPFTSTTFEALSLDLPAIWHDACGFYRGVPYDQYKDIVTHDYKELSEYITKINQSEGGFINPIPSSSEWLDPYRDGKAVHRFRQLLLDQPLAGEVDADQKSSLGPVS